MSLARRVDWALPDPKAPLDDGVRAVRDEIELRVQRLWSELGASVPKALP